MLSIQMASAGDVWISTSTSATKYHKVKDCPGLQNTTATIKKVTESEAKKSTATKTTKKKSTKKSTPARDEKGRFIKQSAE